MSCSKIQSQLPDFVRNQLPPVQSQSVVEHLERCAPCRQREGFERALMAEMASRFAAPSLPEGFEARVWNSLKAEKSQGAPHLAWGGAVAAALVVGLWLGHSSREPVLQPELANAEPPAPLVSEPTLQPVDRTVRLAFNAGEPLDDVTLTLDLPPHVELAGLPGQHRVSWQVSLVQGDNVLELPLTILFSGAGELIAELDAHGRQKVFRAAVPQYPEESEEAAAGSRQRFEEPAS